MISALLSKLKLWGVAVVGFIGLLLTVKFFKNQNSRLKKELVKQKHKSHNLIAQQKSIIRQQHQQSKEIEDAIRNGTYIDYFDDDGVRDSD